MSMGHECPHYLTISWYIMDIWPHSGVKIPRCTSLQADMYSFGIRIYGVYMTHTLYIMFVSAAGPSVVRGTWPQGHLCDQPEPV